MKKSYKKDKKLKSKTVIKKKVLKKKQKVVINIKSKIENSKHKKKLRSQM